MKKRLALLLIIAMTAGMLSACGTKAPEKESETTSTSSETEQSSDESKQASDVTEDGEVTIVKYWNSASGEKAAMDENVEKFNSTIGKENNVRIELEHIESGDYDQQLSVAFQNGMEPDLVQIRPSNIAEYAEKGYIVPLDEVAGIKETVEKSNATQVEGENAWDGKLYMIPIGARIIGLAYNKDMFVSAGIVDENGEAKPPATLEEMIEYAKRLTNPEKRQFGFCLPIGWGAFTEYYITSPSQSSSGMIDGIYNYNTGEFDFEGMRDMAEALLKMKEEGSIYPGAEGLDNDPARARFAEGEIGMMMTVQWDCAVWNDQFPAKCDWGVAPVPVADPDNAYMQCSHATYSYAIASRGTKDGREDAIALAFNYFYGVEEIARRCERGMGIPWNPEIMEMCDFSNSPKGWDDFCKLREISIPVNCLTKSVDLDGMDKFNGDFINKVWSGEQTLDEWILEMTIRYNEGAQRFIDNNSDVVAESMKGRVDPNLNFRR